MNLVTQFFYNIQARYEHDHARLESNDILIFTVNDPQRYYKHYTILLGTRAKIKKYKKHRKTSFLLRRDCHASI